MNKRKLQQYEKTKLTNITAPKRQTKQYRKIKITKISDNKQNLCKNYLFK